jgi:protein involved in polysaccharide export with SLBB domain
MVRLSLLFMLGFFASYSAHAAPVGPGFNPAAEYRLGVGDVVRIEVRDEPDLNIEAQIQTDGIIKYPFLGNLVAKGVTVTRLQQAITMGLRAGYLVNPDVRVRVVTYRPFYVTGQVARAGGYPYVLGLTVEKAATLSGGFTDRASLRNIYVVRESQTQRQKQKVTLDTPIYPGDTIIVEESLF